MENNMIEEGSKKETTLDDIKKGIRVNRALIILGYIPLLAFLAIAVFGYFKIAAVVKDAQPYIQKVKNIDFVKVEKTITEITENVDTKQLSDTLNSISPELIDQIGEIEGYLGQIASLTDMKDDLAGAMEDLENVSNILTQLQESMNPLLSFFGKK